MDIEGDFIGQLCHIEAAEEGGERFNPSMTNDERRAVANLMLMCYPHHVKTNDVNTYTVDVLRKMKSDTNVHSQSHSAQYLKSSQIGLPSMFPRLLETLDECVECSAGPV
jgi:hypothetical protein